jgi:hypothetical protein
MKTSSAFNRYKEILLGIAMLALAVFYMYYATGIKIRSNVSVSAKLIPEILGLVVGILGVLQTINGVRHLRLVQREDKEQGKTPVVFSLSERRDLLPIILTFVLIIGYAMTFERLGFVVSSSLCMFFQIMLLAPRGQRRPGLFAVISVLVAIAVYIAFRKGLDLSLPPGILEGIFV